MSNIITAKIDVTKIDKSRLFEGKNGAKYLDVVLIPTSNSKYGESHMVVQSVSKEERAAGKRGVILGNAKESGQPGFQSNQRRDTEAAGEDVPW